MSAATIAILLQVLEASPQIVSVIEAGYTALKTDFSASDQAEVEAAIAAAKTQLDADVARVEAES
jgi:hypothetical protein